MARLNWINDDVLKPIVDKLLKKSVAAKQNANKKFGKNVIDPFSALFEISGFEIDFDEWVLSETARQAQKTLQNHVGNFHQEILGACEGVRNLKTGSVIDLVLEEKKIVVELKNKYSTISGGKLAELYYSLESLVMPKSSVYKDYTAYYAMVIPKKTTRFDREFTPSDKNKGSKCPSNRLIREIDGASFYSLLTGEINALENLFDVLPIVISEITGKEPISKNKLKTFFDLAYKG